jgi:hypothetical protein
MHAMTDPRNRWRPTACARALLSALLLLLLDGGFTGRALAGSCAPAAPPALQVAASSDAVREVVDMTAAEMRHAAASRGLRPHWPSLSVYIADLGYVADINEEAKAGQGSIAAPRSRSTSSSR